MNWPDSEKYDIFLFVTVTNIRLGDKKGNGDNGFTQEKGIMLTQLQKKNAISL